MAERERPILFSAPMVRAILDGGKTQTRRVAKIETTLGRESILASRRGRTHAATYLLPEHAAEAAACCPYGMPGDRLWVRETWNYFDPIKLPGDRRGGAQAPFTGAQGLRRIEWVAAYAADGPLEHATLDAKARWRPSIHMPRWASRIDLEVTGVRVERLQDISEADAIAEGLELMTRPPEWGGNTVYSYEGFGEWVDTARTAYRALWEQINGPGSWDANPWVWVVEFKRIRP